MVLTITSTNEPATDLGFLLHKNPERLHVADLKFGRAYVFYPERTQNRCTAALILEIDAIGLVRSRRGKSSEGGLFGHYVNDRPYVASSFMSSALTEFFSTAMSGRSKERQEIADQPLALEVRVPVLPCRGGEHFLRSLFEPLGYVVSCAAIPLQEKYAE
jgi:3' terminal RNA ribose 2'-O-methyltransferase Hen1